MRLSTLRRERNPSGEQSLEIKAHQWLNDYYKREWQTDILNFGDDHCIGEDVATLCQFMAKFANAELSALRRDQLADRFKTSQEWLAGERLTRVTAESQLRELTAKRAQDEIRYKQCATLINTRDDQLRELHSTIERLKGELRRFTALEAHLPPGYAVGDDATAELAVKLAEVERQLAELRSGKI